MAIINVDYRANTASLINGTRKAEKAVKSSSVQIGAALTKAAKAAAVAVTAASAAMTALAVRQARAIDQLSKTAQTLGISIDKLQAYRLVAEESGLATNTFDMALQRMTRRVAEAAQGTGEAQGALKELGIDAKNLASLPLEDQFKVVARAMEGVRSQGERVRLAFKLFDSEGVKVVNMLNGFANKADVAESFQRKFNITLNQIDARKVEMANDAMDRARKTIEGLGNTVAVELSGSIQMASNALINGGVNGQTFGIAVSRGLGAAAAGIDLLRHGINNIALVYTSTIFTITDLTAKASRALYRFGEAVAEVGNLIPGVNREARTSFLEVAKASEKMASDSLSAVTELLNQERNFESTNTKIRKANEEANRLAEESLSKIKTQMEGVAAATANTEVNTVKLASSTTNLADKFSKLRVNMKDVEEENRRLFASFVQEIGSARRSVEGLRAIMMRTLQDFAQGLANVAAGGSSGSSLGGILAGKLGGLIDAGSLVSASGTAAFSSRSFFDLTSAASKGFFGPGFARGGIATGPSIFGEAGPEAAVPLPDGKSIPVDLRGGKGGGGTYYIDARGADSAGLARLESTIRELDGSIELRAVAAVQDRFRRSTEFLR